MKVVRLALLGSHRRHCNPPMTQTWFDSIAALPASWSVFNSPYFCPLYATLSRMEPFWALVQRGGPFSDFQSEIDRAHMHSHDHSRGYVPHLFFHVASVLRLGVKAHSLCPCCLFLNTSILFPSVLLLNFFLSYFPLSLILNLIASMLSAKYSRSREILTENSSKS